MELSGYGIAVDLPSGWEGRIYKRPEGDPTLHAGNFPLPVEDGDFGSRALAAMGSGGAFLVVTEYEQSLGRRGLFAPEAPAPLPATSELDAWALLRVRLGQFGIQRFMTIGGRPFCVYLVVGTVPSPSGLLAEANVVLRSLSIVPTGLQPEQAIRAFHQTEPPSPEVGPGARRIR
ncbi:MAG TPA: hypothetical protein VGL18_05820 [Actinomycetota bacterium]